MSNMNEADGSSIRSRCKSFRAENMATFLFAWSAGTAMAAIGAFIAALVCLKFIYDSWYNRGILILIGPFVAIFLGGFYLGLRHFLNLKEIADLQESKDQEDLLLSYEGITIFIGVLIENNFVKSNRPRQRYFLPWSSILSVEYLRHVNSPSLVPYLRLYLADGKHIDIPLRYFSNDGTEVVQHINEFHGLYGPHNRIAEQ